MENSTILKRFSKEFEKLSDVKTDCKLNFTSLQRTSLREKYPNMEFFLVRIFLYLD